MEGSGPDLFVVCKSCGEEVSPYITECPYCGNRLRKRAPKLEKGGMGTSMPKAPRVPRRRPSAPKAPSRPQRIRPRRERAEAPSWASAGRPYATIFIVLGSIVFTLAGRAVLDERDYIVGFDDEPWRAPVSLFHYFSTGYELVALGCAFLFGWLLERRHGFWAPLLVFLLCGTAGLLVADAVDPGVIASGGNGGALGLLAAWSVRDVLVRRRGEDPETDGLGVVVLAVLLILLPIAADEAHALGGAAGGLLGLVLGLPLAKLRARD